MAAGADLVEVDTGLIYAGPGLPKRINEVLCSRRSTHREAYAASQRKAEMSWLWCLLLGIGMLFGSLMALVIATTRQVLPYDESFVCMPREMLAGINSRLLAFMAHDRVSLAGTMVAIGLMYSGLAWFGVRRGPLGTNGNLRVSLYGFCELLFISWIRLPRSVSRVRHRGAASTTVDGGAFSSGAISAPCGTDYTTMARGMPGSGGSYCLWCTEPHC